MPPLFSIPVPTPPQHTVAIVTTSILNAIHLNCELCCAPMGPVRVHEGSSTTNRHHRGKVVQTCSRVRDGCHWTAFLTQTAYFYDDAQRLAQQIQGLRLGRSVLLLPDNYILRPAEQTLAVPFPDGAIECSNSGCCLATDPSRRRRASKLCLRQMCSPCCSRVYQASLSQHLHYDSCRVHNQSSSLTTTQQPVTHRSNMSTTDATSSSSSSTLSTTSPSETVAPPLGDYGSVNPTQSGTLLQTRMLEPINVSVSTTTPPQQSQSMSTSAPLLRVSTQGPSRCAKPLSMPIAPEALQQHQIAQDKADEVKTSKQECLELQEQSKRTCTVILWYENGKPPLRISHFARNYPRTSVDTIDALKPFNFTSSSLLDHWDGGNWNVINHKTVLQANKEKPLLLRIRPSLLSELTDCPSLDKLSQRPQSQTARKRPAEAILVSPPNKLLKTAVALESLADTNASADTVIEILSDSEEERHTQDLGAHSTISGSSTVPRKWPSGYTVSDIQSGLNRIKLLVQKDHCCVTERSAFPEVFSGCVYKKSTVTYVKRTLASTRLELLKQYGGKTWKAFSKARRESAGSGSDEELEPEQTPTVIRDIPREISLEYMTPPPNELSHSTQTISQPVHSPDPDPVTPDIQHTAPFPILPPLLSTSQPSLSEPDLPHSHAPAASNLINELFGYDPDIPLCEFCDEPVTAQPSRTLQMMRENLLKQSWSDPTPDNPTHRRASHFTIYQSYCDRHDLETTQLPTAQAAGWPLNPDFDRLYLRILRLRVALETDILQASPDNLRANIFLSKILKKYKQKASSLSAESVQMEYADHEGSATGTGYYGGEGYQIIYYVLITLLDESRYDLSKFYPLSWDALIRKVLLPEVSVRLIQQDLHLIREQALTTFMESNTFGNLMHPGDDPARLHALQAKIANMFGRANQNLLLWEQSESPLDFDTWSKKQLGNSQRKDSGITIKVETNDSESIIDLQELRGATTIIEGGRTVYVIEDLDDD
ncbi:hypothetical protein QCA50_007310 [Cerrena zonata]|uniref:Restriction of telomere capping protein 4 n=1 Tax=Cerrena zonata TaxID=2478898 RepID=A0AAW0G7Z8_9APHY